MDVCVSSASAGGSEVLSETDQTIPLDVLNGVQTFTDADLVAHGSEWSIIVQVNQIDLTFLASSTLFALDTNQLTANIVSITNGFQLVVSAPHQIFIYSCDRSSILTLFPPPFSFGFAMVFFAAWHWIIPVGYRYIYRDLQ